MSQWYSLLLLFISRWYKCSFSCGRLRWINLTYRRLLLLRIGIVGIVVLRCLRELLFYRCHYRLILLRNFCIINMLCLLALLFLDLSFLLIGRIMLLRYLIVRKLLIKEQHVVINKCLLIGWELLLLHCVLRILIIMVAYVIIVLRMICTILSRVTTVLLR